MRSGVSVGLGALMVSVPLCLLAGAIGWPLMGLFVEFFTTAQDFSALGDLLSSRWVGGVIRFTLWQATLSALLSVGLAFPLARVFAFHEFPGKRFLLSLSILPFALPSILVAFAFVIAYGNSGYVGSLLRHVGLDVTLLYNRWAIVAANVFFNLPFAVRLLAAREAALPRQQIQSSALLGLPWWLTLWHVELPHVARVALNVAILTFSLCLGSFAIAMVLGGAPDLNTTEVAIYQFVRFEFDVPAASCLAAVQLVLTLLAALVYRMSFERGSHRHQEPVLAGALVRPLAGRAWPVQAFCWGSIALYSLFLLLPLSAIVVDGVRSLMRNALSDPATRSAARSATTVSVQLAGLAGMSASVLAWMYVRGSIALSAGFPRLARSLRQLVWLSMGISPTVLAFAWFLVLRATDWAFVVILAVHVVLALPLCVRILLPAVEVVVAQSDRSVKLLGVPAWRILVQIELPALRTPLFLAFALAFALSFGEVAAVALFGSDEVETLPLLLYRLMGAYRFHDAAALSLLLALVCGSVFFIGERYQK